MSNRRLPFGYHLVMGTVEVDPLEVEAVRQIFRDYLSGASLKELAERLNNQPIPYEKQRNWNKNTVARIIGDARYTGEEGFPQIIDPEDLRKVAEMKASKSQPPLKTEAEKAVRQLSGQRTTPQVMCQVLKLMNDLVENPEQIAMPYNMPSANEDASLRRDLDQILTTFPLDEERAKILSMQYATALYEAAGNEEYETDRLRRIFSSLGHIENLDGPLLRSCVAKISVHKNGAVNLILKNNQVIGVGKDA